VTALNHDHEVSAPPQKVEMGRRVGGGRQGRTAGLPRADLEDPPEDGPEPLEPTDPPVVLRQPSLRREGFRWIFVCCCCCCCC